MCGGTRGRGFGQRGGSLVTAAQCHSPLRVIKLGGSLLDMHNWPDRFDTWYATLPPACSMVVVGGGKRVDEIRTGQGSARLDDEPAHWQSIEIMSRNAAMVAETLSDATWHDDLELFRDDVQTPRLAVFDPINFLRADIGPDALPANWDVSSDSIAARVAASCGAAELVLLKSALPVEDDLTREKLVKSGYVDRHFARASAAVPMVRCVNLRAVPAAGVVVVSAGISVRA